MRLSTFVRRPIGVAGTFVGIVAGVLLGGVASGDVTQDPTNAILEMLQRIGGQTTTIDSNLKDLGIRVGDLQVTTEERLAKLGRQVEDLQKTIDGLTGKLDRLRAPARVWVAPYWADWERGERGSGSEAHILFPAYVVALNPGNERAQVRCTLYNENGNLFINRGAFAPVERGATLTCSSTSPSPYFPRKGWIVVSSDRPILPYGWYQKELHQQLVRETMDFYPVDCSEPAGFEFACERVIQ
jgi:hypothetical protein